MIVMQTVDTWPFTMADAAKELAQEQMLTGGGLAIPVIMISKKDSEMVLKMISSNSSTTTTTTTTTTTATTSTATMTTTPTSTSTINSTTTTSSTPGTTINLTSDSVSIATPAGPTYNACVHYSNFTKDCSICQEVFCPSDELVNVELLKLPCRHVYHSHCVMEWLKKVTNYHWILKMLSSYFLFKLEVLVIYVCEQYKLYVVYMHCMYTVRTSYVCMYVCMLYNLHLGVIYVLYERIFECMY